MPIVDSISRAVQPIPNQSRQGSGWNGQPAGGQDRGLGGAAGQASAPPSWTGWGAGQQASPPPMQGPPTIAPTYQGGVTGPLPGLGGPPVAPTPAYQAMTTAKNIANMNAAPMQQSLVGDALAAYARNGVDAGHYDAQRRYLQGDYNSDIARNQNAVAGLDLSRADLGTNRQRVGLDINGRQVDRDYIGQMQGFADRTLANQLAGTQQNRDAEIRNRDWEFGGRGAWFAPARGIENQETRAAADREMDTSRIGRGERQSGWDRDLRQMDLGDQRSQLDYADLGSAERRLDLEAQNLGIARGDLDRMFQQGLEGLGYAESMSAVDLAAMLNSNNAQHGQLANQVTTDIFNYLMAQQDPIVMQIMGMAFANQSGRNP